MEGRCILYALIGVSNKRLGVLLGTRRIRIMYCIYKSDFPLGNDDEFRMCDTRSPGN